jgi:hypothetical protein
MNAQIRVSGVPESNVRTTTLAAAIRKRGNGVSIAMSVWSASNKTDRSRSWIQIWEAIESPTRRKNYELTTPGANAIVFARLKSGADVLVAGDDEGYIHFWDVDSRKELDGFRAHDHQVYRLSFDERNDLLISRGVDNGNTRLRFFDMKTKTEIRKPHTRYADVVFSPRQDFLALIHPGADVELLSLPTFKTVWKRLVERISGPADFSPTTKTLITSEARADGTAMVCFWDVTTGVVTNKIAAHQPVDFGRRSRGGISVANYSPTGLLLASSGQYDDRVALWEAATGQKLTEFPGHSGGAIAVFFYDGDDNFVSVSSGAEIFLCNLKYVKQPFQGEKILEPQEELEKRWLDLQSGNTAKGVVAVESLLKNAKLVVPFLKKKTAAEKPPTAEAISKWISDLASSIYMTRELAAAEIEKHLYLAEPLLKQRLAKDDSVDVRRRIEGLLAKIPKLQDGLTPNELRPLRVISVLERIDSAEAQDLLAWMARHGETQRVRSEATRATKMR